MANIGLFFGSFNPVHHGHLIVAQHMLNTGVFDSIRFVVSPANPFKNQEDLIAGELRLEMVKAATLNNAGFEVSDAEFSLPVPSYTVQTLRHFRGESPNDHFSIIMGSDNLARINEWKEIEILAEWCEFYVYNRRGGENYQLNPQLKIHYFEAPFIDISATHIRHQLQRNKSIRYLVPDSVMNILADQL